MKSALRNAAVVLALLAVLACGSSAYYRGRHYYDRGMYDEAVRALEEARKDNPKDMRFHTLLVRAKFSASQQHFAAAEKALARKDYRKALEELQKSLYYDDSNQRAQDTLQRVLGILAEEEQQAKRAAISLEEMKRQADRASGGKLLDPASDIPLVLKFTNTPVKTVLDAISKASGLNFLYDERADLQKKVTVDFSNARLAKVLDYLMMQTKHFYQVVDAHTLMIIPDNKQKRDEYEEQVMRTFYLSNADAKDVFQLVRSILQARKMAMNQDLNSITIKDTPDMVALAQRIIEANDKSKGEVAVDVELIEVNSNKLKTLGIDLTGKTLTVAPRYNVLTGGTGLQGPPLPSGQWGAQYSGSMYITPLPNFLVNFILTDTDSQVLAKPQLRVMEGKKAMVHIGDKQPIPTANLSYPTTGTGTNYAPMTSYTYQDIGVKIEIEPKVHHNKEITIKLKSEVSSVTGEVPGSGYTPAQPIIGTREVTTEIRLEDGETSMLAGLIREEDRIAYSGLPWLGEVPFLRRLFGKSDTKKFSTDVVLLLTPHIIRMPNITDDDLRALWVGTEQQPRLEGFRETSFAPSPFEEPAEAGATPSAAKPDAAAKPVAGPEKPPDKGAPPAEAPSTKPPQAQAPPAVPPAPQSSPGPSPASAAPQSAGPAGPEPPTAAPQASQARLLVSPTSLQVAPGGQVVLNVVLIGARDAKGLRAEVDYPTDLLTYQGGDEGTFFKMGGGTSAASAGESRPGLISVDIRRADEGSASGSGLVLRLRFTAAKAGLARINIGTANLTDAAGKAAALAPVFSMVTVGGETSGAPAAAKP